jgi:ribosomal protein L29
MKISELRKLSEEELIKKKKELEMEIAGSYGTTKPIIKPEQRRNRRRIIAQILTILNERKLGKIIK